MKERIPRLVLACALVLLVSTAAFAQSSSLSGVVVDSNGGVLPGATVIVKNVATNTTYNAVTNTEGAFTVPALDAGAYSVTASLTGFKTAVINDVRLAPGTPTTIKATLEVGSLEETITVSGGSEIVNTQTATISSTLNVDQINKIPLATRNAINAVTFLPGVNTAGVNRDSNFNGLPDSFVAITLDGVNNNENYNKSTEGLFAMVTPRQDAVEAVTVTTAVGGAEIGSHGAVNISFVTRSGSNRFTGSAYEYFRHPSLNSNYWFNKANGLPRNDVKLNQYGFRQGGPIVIPGLYNGRDKAFFFFNYEELRLPNNFTRTRRVLDPVALSGVFRYTAGGQTRSVNLFDLAAGMPANTFDPLVSRVLGEIRAATLTSGVLNTSDDPNEMDYVWQSPGDQYEKQPVVRLDYNLSGNHRLTGTYNWQVVVRDPDHLNSDDRTFPGMTNFRKYTSYRPLSSAALRSTLTSNLVNEVRGGIKWGPSSFGDEGSNGPQSFEGQGGFFLDFPLGLTEYGNQNAYSARSAWSWNIDNTLSWQKGAHSLSLGGSVYFGNVWVDSQTRVPEIEFGVAEDDPAFDLFTTSNPVFAGAPQAQVTNARNLYALLTGRVINVLDNAALDAIRNQYSYLGLRRQEGLMNDYSVFVQDSWRLRPELTLNGGLRWGVQTPFQPKNDVMARSFYADACGISGVGSNGECRFFEPGAAGGVVPSFVAYNSGSPGYETDWNNVAPNVSAAWRPNVQSGFLRTLLGDPDQATLRAGFSVAYDRQGMERFVTQFGSNPGSTIPLDRTEANGLLVQGNEQWPVLLSQPDRLSPRSIPEGPTYPIAARPNRQDDINIFHPEIKVAYARSWTVSLQRALSSNTAVELRYVGTRGVNQWTEEEFNEVNIIENNFYDEFQVAMANLQANRAAGRGNTFAYTGAPGTAPLPTYLAYFNGSRESGTPSAYSGTNWTNTTFVNRLAPTNPNPYGAAGDLDGNQGRRANALRAGYPENFFVVNPAVDDVGVWTSNAYSDYHALQLELRRRLSRGFQINASYQYALEGGSAFLGRHFGRVMDPSANVRHAFKTQWDYSVPVGRGRRFGGDMNRLLDSIIGGWEFNGAGRVQARTLNFGNTRLVGMTRDELTSEYYFRIDPTTRRVTMLPEDIILNTVRAWNTSATTETGYSTTFGVPEGRYLAPPNTAGCIQLKDGDCAPRTLLVRAPIFTRFDVGLTKRFRFTDRLNFELRMEVLNVFDNINFNPITESDPDDTNVFDELDDFRVLTAYSDLSNTFDPGGRVGQLVFRINW
jgi:hypothetical protein